jgi:integrase
MPRNWGPAWLGGRTYRVGRRTVYVLEAMREGVRYSINLEARDEEEAERELATFDRDPKGYQRPTTAPAAGALRIDAKTIQAVADWQAAEGQSFDHRYATRLYLTAWANALRGTPIEALTLERCEALLTSWKTARKLRIVALKTFCTYYAKRDRLTRDNVAARLSVPAGVARVDWNPRHYSREEIERAYAASSSQVERDVMRLCVTAGLHVTEVERFATGVGRLVPAVRQGEIAGVLWVLHKSGAQHPVSLDAAAFAAAERIRDRGRIPARSKRHAFAVRVAEKVEGDGVRAVQFGALRHTFITLARSAGGRIVRPKDFGVGLEELAQAVGHRSAVTTRRYDGTEIPPMVVFPLTLAHPSDPHVPRVDRRPGARRPRAATPARRTGDRR